MKKLALILARKAQAHWQFPTALLLLSGVLAGIGYSQQFSMPPPAGVQVMGCVYNAVQPTITTGNPGYVQCDVNGNIAAGGGGGSLSAKATAAAPTYVEGSTDPLSMDLSGNTRVGGAWQGATAAAVPANAVYLGVSVGGTLTGLVATSNGLKTDGSAVTQPSSIADGQDTTLGAKADAKSTATDTTAISAMSVLKEISFQAQATAASVAGAIPTGTATIGNVNGAPNVTPTDCSLALTTGTTAQNIITAGASLHGFTIANIDTSEVLWFSMTTTAAPATIASYPLAPATATTFANLSSFTTPFGLGVNGNVSVVAATTGHKISCTKW